MDKEKLKNLKEGTKNLKKDVKSITKGAEVVKKGVGVGLKVLDTVAPEAGQKVWGKMDEVQDFIEEKGEAVEQFMNNAQSKIDEVIGDRIEAVIDKVEHTIQEHGGNKVEKFVTDTVDSVSTTMAPLLKKGAKLTAATAKTLGAQAAPVVEEIGKKVGKAIGTAATEVADKVKRKP